MRLLPFLNVFLIILKEKPAFKYWPRASLYILLSVIQTPFYWLEHIIYGKKIKQHRLDSDPVFILGHWRCGTTAIQHALCLSGNSTFLTQYDAMFPLGVTMHRKLFSPVLQMFFTKSGMRHPSHPVNMSVNFPSEEDIALCMSGFPFTPMWAHICSRNAMKHLEQNLILSHDSKKVRAFLREYNYLIKRISFFNKGKRLVLKSPANTCRIPELLSIFPNAKFIYIQRDPAELYPSTIRLFLNNRIQNINELTGEKMDEMFAYGYQTMIQYFERTKALIPPQNLFEISFYQLREEPVLLQRRVYKFAGLPLSGVPENALSDIKGNVTTTRNEVLPSFMQDMFEIVSGQTSNV